MRLNLSSAAARTNLDNGRWRVLLPGVYATFTGPVGPMAMVWSAVLYAGTGAAACGPTALWLTGAIDDRPALVHVAVPASRRVVRQPGIRIHLSRALDDKVRDIAHPSARPRRLRLEWALLEVCDRENSSMAIHLILQAIQRRLTTAGRLRAALGSRLRHRWRQLICEILAEAADGVASPLELRYRREVERVHGLPAGLRNQPEVAPAGGRSYRDVRYAGWRVLVELDGRKAHPEDQSFRDYRRDNYAAVAGETVLRYGWRDIVGRPCEVASQVGQVLALSGWRGSLVGCRPGCPAAATSRPTPRLTPP
jgi:hypothetical protein